MQNKKNIEFSPKLKEMLDRAREDIDGFWGEMGKELNWFEPWKKVYVEENYPFFKWFVGGKTNISYNCLDYQVFEKKRGEKPAIIWESPETGKTKVLTYRQLLDDVERFAAALKALGVEKGDRVSICMPMVPEAAVAMLATTRLGAIHSVIFAGFGYGAVADRVSDAGSKVMITSDVGFRRGKEVRLKEIVDRALESPNEVQKVIVLRRGEAEPQMKRGRDIYWEEALDLGRGIKTSAVPMESNELSFILYTSGTTAKPKGTVQTHGGYQVHIYSMAKWVYGLNDSDIWLCLSDIGWIVGHSYVVYAPLLIGCTTIMYEGAPDYPEPDIIWKMVEKHKVTRMWMSPTLVRALMKYGDEWPRKHDLSTVKIVVCAGEVLNPPAWRWLSQTVFGGKVPIIDHMWQTESSGPMVGYPYGIEEIPIKPGSAGIPLPGIQGDVVDKEGRTLPPGEEGIFVVRKPFPGLTQTLWRANERYAEEYWNQIPKCYYTGDAAKRDEDGYIWFIARADEVIKIAGHRIGTIEIESAFINHPAVAEAAVTGEPDPLRGEVATAFVVLKKGYAPSEELKEELKKTVRNVMGPLVVFGNISFVEKIPKTRSGKIMRRLIKAIITGSPLGDYSTIEDSTAIDEIKRALQGPDVK
ncbi:MAG: acetate--CoA ligase [Candidatus Hadarchaeum sp.]|uniref:acetate--CoA ligase n=2 Tax=Candidatus Hadarchaeum sp. TaxID=2883567 RepID=UPI00316B5FD8